MEAGHDPSAKAEEAVAASVVVEVESGGMVTTLASREAEHTGRDLVEVVQGWAGTAEEATIPAGIAAVEMQGGIAVEEERTAVEVVEPQEAKKICSALDGMEALERTS